MLKRIGILLGCFLILLVGAFLGNLTIAQQTDRARAASSGFQPLVAVSSLPVDCGVGVSIEDTFSKIVDIGNFQVNSADSFFELTFNGRVGANTMTGTGVIFELRVDDSASSIGRVRTVIKSSEIGFNGVPVSFSGVFSGLSTGQHTINLWARAPFGTASFVEVDPNCWGTDKVLVIEHLPFGSIYLPAVSSD